MNFGVIKPEAEKRVEKLIKQPELEMLKQTLRQSVGEK